MYACLQKAKCDEYDTMPRIEDYNRCTPPRAHTEVKKAHLRCSYLCKVRSSTTRSLTIFVLFMTSSCCCGSRQPPADLCSNFMLLWPNQLAAALCFGNQRTHIFERRCIAVASSALALASELRRNRLCSDIVRTSKYLPPVCFSETVLDSTVSHVCHIRACDSGYRDKRDTVNNVGHCIVGCSIGCRESAVHTYAPT